MSHQHRRLTEYATHARAFTQGNVSMVDRSSPAFVLGAEIRQLEAEIECALASCPSLERAAVEKLRERLLMIKTAAERDWSPTSAARR